MHHLNASALPTVLESSRSCEGTTAELAAFYFCARGPPGQRGGGSQWAEWQHESLVLTSVPFIFSQNTRGVKKKQKNQTMSELAQSTKIHDGISFK